MVKVEKMPNLFKSLGFTVHKLSLTQYVHRLIHRNCGYPKVYPSGQMIKALGLNALHTKNYILLRRSSRK